jgi:dihydroneopterin aldolase
MSIISIEGIECYAYHGCLAEEKIIGGKFSVDVIFETDLAKAIQSDNLSDTIDYGSVKNIVVSQMKTPSNLIEHVAGRILKKLISDFSFTENITVKVTKHNPPVNGFMEKASVMISKKEL